ncbi:MAG: DUF5667 domain-containing protein [Candidatus Colwellbacteria bacterium]
MHRLTYGRLVVLSLLILAASPLLSVVAQEEEEAVVESDIQINNVGILPTNPFYFIKEWGRSIRRAVIMDPVKRAEFELDITEEKAKELERVSDIEGEDESSIEKATINYEKSVVRLQDRLERLGEQSDNPRIEELLGSLAQRAGAHQELIETLKVRYKQFENLRTRFEEVKNTIDSTVESAARGVQTLERIQERIQTMIDEGRDNEGLQRVLEVIERTRVRFPGEETGGESGDTPRIDMDIRGGFEERLRQFRDDVQSSGVIGRPGEIGEQLRNWFNINPSRTEVEDDVDKVEEQEQEDSI